MKFIAPAMLWALLIVPLLIAGYLALQRRRRTYAVRFTNLELLSTVAPKSPGWRRHVAPCILLLTFIVLIGALARPAIAVKVPRQQSLVMLAIDVSRSMSATDLEPSRIVAAKRAAHAFIKSVPNSMRIGIVTFSNSAQLISPLSRARGPASQAIENLRPVAGTAMGEGLNLALQEISRARAADGETPASILLLSDGKSNRGTPPASATVKAKAMKIPIFAVGVGTKGAVLQVEDRQVPVDIDEAELRTVTSTTGGKYFESASSESLQRVYKDLGSALGYEPGRKEISSFAAGLAALLLLIGALTSLLWFQRIP